MQAVAGSMTAKATRDFTPRDPDCRKTPTEACALDNSYVTIRPLIPIDIWRTPRVEAVCRRER